MSAVPSWGQHRAVTVGDHRVKSPDRRIARRCRPAPPAGRTVNCASMSSRPLFIMVAESIEILSPMSQLGWANACSGVTSAMSGQRPVTERTARRRQDEPVPRRDAGRGSKTWKMALCSESTGRRTPPDCSMASISRRPRADEGLLVGKGYHRAATRRRQRRGEACKSDHRRHHPLRRPFRCFDDRIGAGGGLDRGCRPMPPLTPRNGSDQPRPRGVPAGVGACSASNSTELRATRASTR